MKGMGLYRGKRDPRMRHLTHSLAGGLALLLASTCGNGVDARRTRIVLITADTLRFDSFTAAGMPHTRRFAEAGLVFENAFAACSTTQPTHASIFTGLHPWQHGVTRNGAVLEEDHETLAEHLLAQGFDTAAFVASFPVHSKFGFAQGFRTYRDDFVLGYSGFEQWGGEQVVDGKFHSPADWVTDAAIAHMQASEAPRQFLWLHYFDPHDPYGDRGEQRVGLGRLKSLAASGDPTLPNALEQARSLYEFDVAFLDEALGRLFAFLERDGEDRETHVLLTSDHGESFGEEGALGHGFRLTREQVHVPCFLVSPRVEPGIREDYVGSVDVAATLLALAASPASPKEGHDLLAGESQREAVFGMRKVFKRNRSRSEGAAPTEAEGPWFFLAGKDGLLAGNSERVFRDDVGDREADFEASAGVRTLFSLFERQLAGTETRDVVDQETLDILKSLGY